jgi:tetratricopeptide (TPR) repeat protein
MDLQADVLDGVLRTLEITPPEEATAAEASRAVALDVQKKLSLGKQAFLKGDYQAAIDLAEQALRLDAAFAEAVGFVGVCHARLGRYDEAAERHRQLKALAVERGDRCLLVEAEANLGAMNYFRGEYDTAYEFYQEAARVAEQLRMTSALGQIYNNLGFVLFRLERQSEAEQAFARAIEIHREFGALVSLVAPYNGMGNVLLGQGRYTEARSFYRRALLLAQEIDDRTKVGLSHMHLGRCASLAGDYAEAKNEFALALNALEETSFWNGLARAYEYVAEMHLRLDHYDEAIRCAEQRIELARRHANRRMESSAWQQKAEALRRAGRTEDAAACLERA